MVDEAVEGIREPRRSDSGDAGVEPASAAAALALDDAIEAFDDAVEAGFFALALGACALRVTLEDRLVRHCLELISVSREMPNVFPLSTSEVWCERGGILQWQGTRGARI